MDYPQRRLSILLAASLATMASTAHPACAAPDATKLRAVLQSEYDGMNAALAHGDLTRYLSYHAADYRETDPQGRHPQSHGREQDRAQAKTAIQWVRHFNAVNHTQFHYHDAVKTLNRTENSVAVTTEERSSIQPQLVESEQDVWVRQGGRWLIKQRRHGIMHGAQPVGEAPQSPAAQSAP